MVRRFTPASSVTSRLAVARDVAQEMLTSLDGRTLAQIAITHLDRLVRYDGVCIAVTAASANNVLQSLAYHNVYPASQDVAFTGPTGENASTRPSRPTARRASSMPAPVSTTETTEGLSVRAAFRQPLELVTLFTRLGAEMRGTRLPAFQGPLSSLLELAAAEDADEHATVAVVPLQRQSEVFGALFMWRFGDEGFHADDVAFAEELSAPLALALENARLHDELNASLITLKLAQNELVRREQLAAVGNMAAVMAHEVRTPLAVMLNAASSLRKFGKTEGDEGMLLSIVEEETRRLERLIKDLLEFARPGHRTRDLVDVGDFVMECAEAAKGDARFHESVEIVLSLNGELGSANWDVRGLRHALVNLLVNAAQATHSEQTRRGASAEAFEVSLSVFAEGDGARVVVEDRGAGVSRAVLAEMFEPFVTTRAQGMGLGLAVVRRVVEEHQGEVLVTSDGTSGARFELRLPRRLGAG